MCGSGDLKPYSMAGWSPDKLHFAQVKCQGCGLLISQPQCTGAEAAAYYGGPYYSTRPDPEAVWVENVRQYGRYELPLLERFWSQWLEPGARILEAGSGCGEMLHLLSTRQMRSIGVDLSVSAIRFAKERSLAVLLGEVVALPVKTASCDGALSLHVIEHLLDPRGFVFELARVVRPGGVVAIVTEDAYIAQHRWERRVQSLKGDLPAFRSSFDHTFVFSAEHLIKLLHEAGCDVVQSFALTRNARAESLHWRIYKGLFKLIDRLSGHGEILIAAGRLREAVVEPNTYPQARPKD